MRREEPVNPQLVSGGYFNVLGARIVAGRPLTQEDVRNDRPAPVAVVGDGFAKRRLGGVEKAIGQELIVNSLPVTVVGVAGAAFVGAWTDAGADMWLPLTLQHDLGYRANVSSYANADSDGARRMARQPGRHDPARCRSHRGARHPR
jgi:hypothetical protein